MEPVKLLSGHLAELLPEDEDTKQRKDWEGYTHGLLRLNPGKWIVTAPFVQFADNIFKFKFDPTDVFVMTWPKCGTTWVQEILWTMKNNPNLDNPVASTPVNIRCPFMDLDMILISDNIPKPTLDSPFIQEFFKLCPDGDPSKGIMLQLAGGIPKPRTIKTHLPFSLMGKKMLQTSKVVYVARNPKDVVVSYYHHSRLMKNHGYVGSLDEFVDYFINGDLLYGSYDAHLKEAWSKKDDPNLHIIFYEDLKAEPFKQLSKLNDFLGTNLTDEQLQMVEKYTSFEEMKKRDNVLGSKEENAGIFNNEVLAKDGGFFRKGETGSWRQKLTPEQEAKITKWVDDNLKDVGVDFKYST